MRIFVVAVCSLIVAAGCGSTYRLVRGGPKARAYVAEKPEVFTALVKASHDFSSMREPGKAINEVVDAKFSQGQERIFVHPYDRVAYIDNYQESGVEYQGRETGYETIQVAGGSVRAWVMRDVYKLVTVNSQYWFDARLKESYGNTTRVKVKSSNPWTSKFLFGYLDKHIGKKPVDAWIAYLPDSVAFFMENLGFMYGNWNWKFRVADGAPASTNAIVADDSKAWGYLSVFNGHVIKRWFDLEWRLITFGFPLTRERTPGEIDGELPFVAANLGLIGGAGLLAKSESMYLGVGGAAGWIYHDTGAIDVDDPDNDNTTGFKFTGYRFGPSATFKARLADRRNLSFVATARYYRMPSFTIERDGYNDEFTGDSGWGWETQAFIHMAIPARKNTFWTPKESAIQIGLRLIGHDASAGDQLVSGVGYFPYIRMGYGW